MYVHDKNIKKYCTTTNKLGYTKKYYVVFKITRLQCPQISTFLKSQGTSSNSLKINIHNW